MPSRPQPLELCASGARRVGEPLFGTASRVDLWLVLEVRGAWAHEVEATIEAGSTLGRALQPVLQAVPRSRLLFIKGAPRGQRETLAFYVAVTDEVASRLYHFELESYEALLGIDLFGVLAEEERYEAYRDPRPLFLVCTHGTHDRCCAKFGYPTYLSLARSESNRVWQSSHVGGDRFAANVVCLPEGLYYGHVEPEEHAAFLECATTGRLYPSRWRGRACYPPPSQAAEHYLRQAQAETRVAAYRLWSHRRRGTVTEAAFLADGADGEDTLHTLRVEPVELEGLRGLTCGTPEAKPVTSYRLLEHRETSFAPEIRSAGTLEFHFRPAAMRDYGFIYRLRRETLQGSLDALEMPAEEQSPFLARFDVMRHRLITTGPELAGAVSVLEREAELHLANLHLLPAFQGRGLGTAIVRELQSRARASHRRVTTQVLKVNPACAFYERLGFRQEGEQGPRFRMVWEP